MYEKKEAAGTEPAKLVFYYPTEDIFDDASLRSMYQARNKKTEAGDDLTDDFSITEDERDIFNGLVKDGVYEVFLNFLKYTTAIDNAIETNRSYIGVNTVALINAFEPVDLVIGRTYEMSDGGDLTYGDTVTVVEGDIVYYNGTLWVVDADRTVPSSYVQIANNENYNQNYLRAVDENLFKGLRFHVLRDWASILSSDSDEAKYARLYNMAKSNIDRYGFQLKKVLT